MQRVFRIHGFPQDMISDRGSQFTSRFWKAFGHLIGSDISLVCVPAAAQQVQRCQRTWQKAGAALLKSTQQQHRQANRCRRLGPILYLGHRVWLSTRDLPLQVESRKFAPHFVNPFKILRTLILWLTRHFL